MTNTMSMDRWGSSVIVLDHSSEELDAYKAFLLGSMIPILGDRRHSRTQLQSAHGRSLFVGLEPRALAPANRHTAVDLHKTESVASQPFGWGLPEHPVRPAGNCRAYA